MFEFTVTPAQNGTAKVKAGPFTDEDSPPNEITPLTVTWTLTDQSGNVINERANVPVTPATTVAFLLTANDLAITGHNVQRVIMLTWTYDSTQGDGLVGRAQGKFSIEKMVGIVA